jgi:hypothetical protein
MVKGKPIQHNFSIGSNDTNVMSSASQGTLVGIAGSNTNHGQSLIENEPLRRGLDNIKGTQTQSVGCIIHGSNESIPATNRLT